MDPGGYGSVNFSTVASVKDHTGVEIGKLARLRR